MVKVVDGSKISQPLVVFTPSCGDRFLVGSEGIGRKERSVTDFRMIRPYMWVHGHKQSHAFMELFV